MVPEGVICAYEGCLKPIYRRQDLCSGHYQQRNKGKPLTPLGAPKLSVRQRFEAKFTPGSPDECWIWQASRYKNGYGVFNNPVSNYAHRVSYWLYKGELTPGLVIDHMCHTRDCVNPNHLQQVTHIENCQNRAGINPNNVSGYRGVTWDKTHRKWLVNIRVNGKHQNFGRFDDVIEAAKVAKEVRLNHYPNSLKDFEDDA